MGWAWHNVESDSALDHAELTRYGQEAGYSENVDSRACGGARCRGGVAPGRAGPSAQGREGKDHVAYGRGYGCRAGEGDPAGDRGADRPGDRRTTRHGTPSPVRRSRPDGDQ